MTLQEIGLKHGTDKATFHRFCDTYDNYMNKYREDNINLLEIGVQNGFSLFMWREYFKNGIISGVDIFDKKNFESERIKIYKANQEIPSELLSIPGEFDIIIEDGGHTMKQQQVSLNVMMDRLKSRGIFILEDLHTSHPGFAGYQHFGANENNNTIRLLNDLKRGEMTSSEYFINEVDFNNLKSKIDSIEIFEIEPADYNAQGCPSITSIIIKK